MEFSVKPLRFPCLGTRASARLPLFVEAAVPVHTLGFPSSEEDLGSSWLFQTGISQPKEEPPICENHNRAKLEALNLSDLEKILRR